MCIYIFVCLFVFVCAYFDIMWNFSTFNVNFYLWTSKELPYNSIKKIRDDNLRKNDPKNWEVEKQSKTTTTCRCLCLMHIEKWGIDFPHGGTWEIVMLNWVLGLAYIELTYTIKSQFLFSFSLLKFWIHFSISPTLQEGERLIYTCQIWQRQSTTKNVIRKEYGRELITRK